MINIRIECDNEWEWILLPTVVNIIKRSKGLEGINLVGNFPELLEESIARSFSVLTNHKHKSVQETIHFTVDRLVKGSMNFIIQELPLLYTDQVLLGDLEVYCTSKIDCSSLQGISSSEVTHEHIIALQSYKQLLTNRMGVKFRDSPFKISDLLAITPKTLDEFLIESGEIRSSTRTVHSYDYKEYLSGVDLNHIIAYYCSIRLNNLESLEELSSNLVDPSNIAEFNFQYLNLI